MSYSSKMLDHCEHPRNVGSLDEAEQDVGTGMVGSPTCGDMLKLQIKVSKNIITDAKFKTFGCGGAISSSSLMTEKIIGKTLEEAVLIKNKEIIEELQLPKAKIHCSVMCEEALLEAVKDYKKKNNI